MEQYNFDLLEGMEPMVFVPSSVQFRADRRNSCGAYLCDGNDNRVYDDASIVDRERERWREYCASLFREGLAPFPSDVAVSPPRGSHGNGQCLSMDDMATVPPEYVVNEGKTDHTKTVVPEEDDDTPETVLPMPIKKYVAELDIDVVSKNDRLIEVPEISLTVWHSRFRSGTTYVPEFCKDKTWLCFLFSADMETRHYRTELWESDGPSLDHRRGVV